MDEKWRAHSGAASFCNAQRFTNPLFWALDVGGGMQRTECELIPATDRVETVDRLANLEVALDVEKPTSIANQEVSTLLGE